MALLRSLFSRSSKKQPKNLTYETIKAMGLHDLIDETRDQGREVDLHTMGAISRRLYEIGLFEHQLSQDDRAMALAAADACVATIKGAIADNPEALAALRKATDSLISQAPFNGYGSLHWLIEENAIRAEEIVPYAMKLEHSHLVPNFLKVLSEETITNIRPGLVRELVRARRAERVYSAVFILHGLAVSRDPATVALFNETEIRALRAAHLDYDRARSVLVDLDLLASDEINSFEPMPTIDQLTDMVVLSLTEVWDQQEEDADRAAFANEAERMGLAVTRHVLGLHLLLSQIASIYGNEVADEVRARAIAAFPKAAEEGFARVVDATEMIERGAFEKAEVSPDVVLYDWILNRGEGTETTDDEWERTSQRLDAATPLLTSYRATVLDRFRTSLWFFVREAASGGPFEPDRVGQPVGLSDVPYADRI